MCDVIKSAVGSSPIIQSTILWRKWLDAYDLYKYKLDVYSHAGSNPASIASLKVIFINLKGFKLKLNYENKICIRECNI